MTEETTRPRVRVNAKQTSKGEYYFDATAETDNVPESAQLLIDAIKSVEEKFRAAGKTLVEKIPISTVGS